MQKYKFNIRKIEESEVEIQAKNKREALKKLLGFVAHGDKKYYKRIFYKKTYYKIKLNEISNKKVNDKFNDEDEINKDVVRYLLSENEDENNEDTDEDNIKVIKKQCKNCTLLGDIIHHLKS